jgi:hypothetical protein
MRLGRPDFLYCTPQRCQDVFSVGPSTRLSTALRELQSDGCLRECLGNSEIWLESCRPVLREQDEVKDGQWSLKRRIALLVHPFLLPHCSGLSNRTRSQHLTACRRQYRRPSDTFKMGERILIEMTGILHQNTWCLFADVRGSGSCVYDIKEAPGYE